MREIILISALILMLMIPIGITDAKPTDTADTDKIKGDTEKIISTANEIKKSISVDISVGATEYQFGDIGKVFAKVTENGIAVNNALVDSIIYFPNESTFTTFRLDYLPQSRGIYSNNFTIPSIKGVYIVDVEAVKPVMSINQSYFLVGSSDFNLNLLNNTGSGVVQIEIENLTQQVGKVCFPTRWTSNLNQYSPSGTFKEPRFISNITNVAIWVRDQVCSREIDTELRFYREGSGGEVLLGVSAIDETTHNTTFVRTVLPNITVNQVFPPDSVISVEWCARATNNCNGTNDFQMEFNSSLRDSQFKVNSLALNATTDFLVGGSSELNVQDFAIETAILTNTLEKLSNHNICISNSTLQHNITLAISGNNRTIIELETCPYGCDLDNHRCNDSPLWTYLIWLAVALFLLIGTAIVWRKMS